jgi:hypothetical protein
LLKQVGRLFIYNNRLHHAADSGMHAKTIPKPLVEQRAFSCRCQTGQHLRPS